MSALKPMRFRRGQAMVEMSILMLVLIPTFFYMLTSDDLMRYRLELQEVVVASPWDYTHLNYEKSSIKGEALVSKLRQGYSDLNSGFASYSGDDARTGRRTAPMTFAGWKVQGSQEVSCAENAGYAQATYALAIPMVVLWEAITHGGLYSCQAALGVSNVELIGGFMQQWASEQLTDKARGEGGAGGVWQLNQQRFSVMADTWAVTEVKDANADSAARSTVLGDRVETVYMSTPSMYQAFMKAAQVAQAGSSAGVLQAVVIQTDTTYGDLTMTPEIGFSKKAAPEVSSNRGFDSSPWKTEGAAGAGTYEQAYNGRTNAYLGRAEGDW